jgi:GT2 family glycosyltransferase
MKTSIVIATYNRAKLLDDCLAHLANQSFEDGDEIVVVDNGSTDRTADVIKVHAGRMPVRLRYLVEPRAGKSHALNRALEIAGGDVLAFTDDDVNVSASWLSEIRRAMADPAVGLTGGPVLPRWEQPPPRWLAFDDAVRSGAAQFGHLGAPLALLSYGPEASVLGPRTLLGANLAVRREVFDRLGGFAAHLGKKRGTLLSGEDHDLCARAQEAGFKAVYAPSACVFHWVPADRLRIRYFVNWFFWSGITYAALERGANQAKSFAGVPGFIVKRLMLEIGQAAREAVLGHGTAAVTAVTHAAFATGYAARCWGFARSATTSLAGAAGSAR